MAITPLPTPPQPTDSTSEFNTKAFAWVDALDDFVTETNATAAEVNADKDAAAASAASAALSKSQTDASGAGIIASATAQADIAESFAESAESSANAAAAATAASLWVSGTTYAIGALVWSPINARIYRRLTAGAGTTDPSADAVNWLLLSEVLEQADIGTDPNQVPLNQYLGSMAYRDKIGIHVMPSAAPTVASATSITVSTPVVFVSGTTAIETLLVTNADAQATGCQITLIPTGLWTTVATGNIALASTAVVSKALTMTYDAGTEKWYPSY